MRIDIHKQRGTEGMEVMINGFEAEYRPGLAARKAAEDPIEYQQFWRTQQVADESDQPAFGAIEIHRPLASDGQDALLRQPADLESQFQRVLPFAGGSFPRVGAVAQGQRIVLGDGHRAQQAAVSRQDTDASAGFECIDDALNGGLVRRNDTIAPAPVERDHQVLLVSG